MYVLQLDAICELIADCSACEQPDLPYRLKHNIPAEKGDRSLYYSPWESPLGYVDYPFADGLLGSDGVEDKARAIL